MRVHFAETYALWGLLWPLIAIPGLAAGLALGWLRGRLQRRPPRSYLGDWPADYDVLELARLPEPK